MNDRAMTMDRRMFLRTGLGVAGATLIGAACGTPTGGVRATSACSMDQPCSRPTVRQDTGFPTSFPSPFTSALLPSYAKMIWLYDTLLWNDSTGALLPWLASAYSTSPDGLTYTYQLRENVRWHDGRPFSAEDVVFSFEYTTAFKGPEPLGVPSVPVQVTATGTHTVEVRLAQPTVTFQTFTAATLPIIPKHIWSSISEPIKAQDLGVLVGTGPYKVTSFSLTQGTTRYEAYDDYFLGKPFVKAIEFHNVANNDPLGGVLNDEIDVGISPQGGVRPSGLAPFRNDGAYGVVPTAAGYAITLRWNLARGGPLADVQFRRACAMAISRDDIVSRLVGGNGDPGNPGYLAPHSPYYDPSVEQYRFDPAAAGRLLDQAGYKMGHSKTRLGLDGKPLRFSLLVNSSSPAVGQLVISSLAAIGIELTSQGVEIPVLFGRLTPGDYDMAVAFNGGAKGDPDVIRQNFCTPGFDDFRHTQGYNNPQLNALGQQQFAASDPAVRRQLVNEMQAMVATDIPILTLYYATSYLVFRKLVFDQWGSVHSGVDGGPFYNPQKHSYVFGVANAMKARPELA